MNTPLQHAVWAVIARWESPAWKDMPHTGEYIDAMRKALADEQAQTANSRIGFLYEELRKATDGGSESMTHDDALKQIADWQDKEQAQAVEPAECDSPKLCRINRGCAGKYGTKAKCLTPPATGECAKVSDSRFESWYSESAISHERKQAMREAYEAGLNEAQQVAVPVNWKAHIQTARNVYSDYLDVQEALSYLEQVFLAATPAPPLASERDHVEDNRNMVGERAELIARLRGQCSNEEAHALLETASDMLEADGKAQQVAVPALHKLIEGMTVSIDVSTGEHDAGNRLFGVVSEVIESSGDKNGLTLLVYETTPNFKQAQQVAVPVPMSGYEISKWWASENGLEDCNMYIHGDFEKVVRAIEARHRIGTAP